MTTNTYFRMYRDNGNGTASPTSMAKCAVTGNVAQCAPPKMANALPISTVKNQNGGNHAIITNSNMQQQDNMAGTIKAAESQQGDVFAYRSEGLESNFPFAFRIVNLTLTNGGAAAVTVPIGDYLGFNADALALPALPGTLTITGTFGANTLANIKAMSGVTPLSIKGIRFQASVVGFFSSGFVKTSLAQVDGTTTLTDLQAQTWPQASDFTPTIQNKMDLRYLLNPLSALLVNVPAGQNVTLTFNVGSYAAVYGMKKSAN